MLQLKTKGIKRSPNYFEDYFEHLHKYLTVETIQGALWQLILNLLQREHGELLRTLENCALDLTSVQKRTRNRKKTLVITQMLKCTKLMKGEKNKSKWKLLLCC